MKKITINDGELVIRERVVGYFQKQVTKFGNGAKVDCPKDFLGKNVYVIICDE
jgi:putative transposon-encoded protein